MVPDQTSNDVSQTNETELVTDGGVDVETYEIVCHRCSGTVVENTSDRFEAGEEMTHFVRCIDCGGVGWVRIIDEQVAELVGVVRPDDYSDYSATLANSTPVTEWIGDWRQSAVDAGVIDQPELVTDGGVNLEIDDYPTCNGITNTREDCQRRLTDSRIMDEEENYCHDHKWQAGFVSHHSNSLTQILPQSETVSLEVHDVQVVEYDYCEMQRIETQYGVAEIGTDRTVRAGRIYDATASTDPHDFHQLTLTLTEVGRVDDD